MYSGIVTNSITHYISFLTYISNMHTRELFITSECFSNDSLFTKSLEYFTKKWNIWKIISSWDEAQHDLWLICRVNVCSGYGTFWLNYLNISHFKSIPSRLSAPSTRHSEYLCVLLRTLSVLSLVRARFQCLRHKFLCSTDFGHILKRNEKLSDL